MADATVRETLDNWINNKSGALAVATLEEYKQAAGLFIAFLGNRADKSIRQITERDAVGFRDWLAKDRSSSTVNKLKAHVSGAFQSAKDEGILEQNFFSLTDNLKVVAVERDTFTAEQVGRLVAAAPTNEWKGMIILGYTLAARLMDVANMRWSNVDLENGLLEFRVRKTGKKRYWRCILISLNGWRISGRRTTPKDYYSQASLGKKVRENMGFRTSLRR